MITPPFLLVLYMNGAEGSGSLERFSDTLIVGILGDAWKRLIFYDVVVGAVEDNERPFEIERLDYKKRTDTFLEQSRVLSF